MATTNLPKNTSYRRGSDKEVQKYFDQYFTKPLEFSSNEVDAVIGFFSKRGFEQSAAIAVGSTLLQQAKLDNVKVFKLLDTLNGLDEVQLSAIVAEIMNYNRPKTSTVGYRRAETFDKTESRNIKV